MERNESLRTYLSRKLESVCFRPSGSLGDIGGDAKNDMLKFQRLI